MIGKDKYEDYLVPTVHLGNSAVATIRTGLRQLLELRWTHHDPLELEWEMQLYAWILGQTDSEEKAQLYLNYRHMFEKSLSKRETIRKLGWKI